MYGSTKNYFDSEASTIISVLGRSFTKCSSVDTFIYCYSPLIQTPLW